MVGKLHLSLVIPAYKQEKTILKDIKSIQETLYALPYKYEIIVVVDGFLDKTYEILKKIKDKNIQVIGYEQNHGKGYAISYGVREADGDIIGFIDAGMDIDPTEISLMLDIMQFNNADIVIGSKLHPQSKVQYPLSRHILSFGYRLILHILFDLNVRDTQVGIKFFKKKVAKDIFSRVLVKHFAFDIEALAIAQALGYKKIYEAPIKLNFTGISTITSKNFWRVIYIMLIDTLAVFYRLRIIHYYNKKKY
jgi:glycosyltransferase involved in cell wall biosynthesis